MLEERSHRKLKQRSPQDADEDVFDDDDDKENKPSKQDVASPPLYVKSVGFREYIPPLKADENRMAWEISKHKLTEDQIEFARMEVNAILSHKNRGDLVTVASVL